MLTQPGAPSHVIGWTNFSHWHSMHAFDFVEIFKIVLDLSTICFSHFSGWSASFVYDCHSFLECYNLFSRVRLSIRSFCFISCLYFLPRFVQSSFANHSPLNVF